MWTFTHFTYWYFMHLSMFARHGGCLVMTMCETLHVFSTVVLVNILPMFSSCGKVPESSCTEIITIS